MAEHTAKRAAESDTSPPTAGASMLEPEVVVSPRHDALRAYLFRGASASFLIQVAFAGLAFLNSLLLARWLGAGSYGAYANAMAWVSLLTIPANFGFGPLLVREVAVYRSQENWSRLKGILRVADGTSLILSVLLSAALLMAANWLLAAPDQSGMRRTLAVASALLPLFALSTLRQAATRGLEHVIRARLPGMIVRPAVLLAGILVIHVLSPGHLSAPTAMGINVVAAAVALGVGVYWLRSLLPVPVKQAVRASEPLRWLRAAAPMLIYGNAQIVLGQTDVVMLGALRGAQDVGVYAVATRLAYLLQYVTVAAEMVLAPVMARLYANGEKEALQKILTRVVRISFVAVLPFGVAMVIVGYWLLGIFGSDFVAARTALAILAVGQLLQVAAGSAALFLAMTGHERTTVFVLTGSVFGNVVLNAILIPRLGIEGAAIASVISLGTAKLLLTGYVGARTGIKVSILGSLYRRR